MKRRRNHHLVDHRVDQVSYHRPNHGRDEIYEFHCNKWIEDSPMVPPRQRPIPGDVGEHMYDAIVNPAACGEDNHSTETEGPSEPRYAVASVHHSPWFAESEQSL